MLTLVVGTGHICASTGKAKKKRKTPCEIKCEKDNGPKWGGTPSDVRKCIKFNC